MCLLSKSNVVSCKHPLSMGEIDVKNIHECNTVMYLFTVLFHLQYKVNIIQRIPLFNLT